MKLLTQGGSIDLGALKPKIFSPAAGNGDFRLEHDSMHACMCACVHVCMCACVHAYVHAYAYVCARMCQSGSIVSAESTKSLNESTAV